MKQSEFTSQVNKWKQQFTDETPLKVPEFKGNYIHDSR